MIYFIVFRRLPTFVFLLVLIYAPPILANALDAPSEFKDSARLERMIPSSSSVRRGRNKIEVDFTFYAIPSESVEYIGILTVNGSPQSPITFVLTPGEISVKTSMRWHILANGSHLSVRFRLIGVGNITKSGYGLIDVTKDYLVVEPITRPRRRCHC